MLAVQSVPVEKDEVRARRTIDRFVDAKQVLDRRSGATLGAGVERSDPNDSSGFAERGLASSNLSPALRGRCPARLCALPRPCPWCSSATPPLL